MPEIDLWDIELTTRGSEAGLEQSPASTNRDLLVSKMRM